MRPPLEFFVPGLPATGGSKRGFVHRHTGRVIVTEDCSRSKPWRASVQAFAMDAMLVSPGQFAGPLRVTFEFRLPRPKGHMGKRGIKAAAPAYPAKKPDLLKFARAAEDALNGVAWHDDSQIVTEVLRKRYALAPGMMVRIQEENGDIAEGRQ